MRKPVIALVIGAYAVLAACSGDNGTPCEGTFTYSNGSMPPPHSYRWTVTFDEGAGSIAWTSPYASPQPEWSAEFTPDADSLVALCDAIRDAPRRGDGVGGAVASWETSAGSGATDMDAAKLAAVAIELVGSDTYEGLRTRYEAWRAEQE